MSKTIKIGIVLNGFDQNDRVGRSDDEGDAAQMRNKELLLINE